MQMALTLQLMDRRKIHNLRDRGKLGCVESKKGNSMRGELQEWHGSQGHPRQKSGEGQKQEPDITGKSVEPVFLNARQLETGPGKGGEVQKRCDGAQRSEIPLKEARRVLAHRFGLGVTGCSTFPRLARTTGPSLSLFLKLIQCCLPSFSSPKA